MKISTMRNLRSTTVLIKISAISRNLLRADLKPMLISDVIVNTVPNKQTVDLLNPRPGSRHNRANSRIGNFRGIRIAGIFGGMNSCRPAAF